MARPLILDFDGSLAGFVEAERIPLGELQEDIRFGCRLSTWNGLREKLQALLPPIHGTVLMGSGDFHHLSHLLIERIACREKMDVVVCDNHPDNMRYPWGIHCGSWVRHAAMLPQVRTVHVVGITSKDVAWPHALENYLGPLYRRKLHYWTIGPDTRWTALLGLSSGVSAFSAPDALLQGFAARMRDDTRVYLSIDKDVLHPDVAHTNWDQGCFALMHLDRLIDALAGRIIGSDITGEVSAYRYRSRWKRWLSAIDGQPEIAPAELSAWQAQQVAVDRHLIQRIQSALAVVGQSR